MMNPLGSVCLICICPQRSLAPWPTQLLIVYTLVRWTVRKAMALVFSPERRAETSNHMMCQVQVTEGTSLSSLLFSRSVISDWDPMDCSTPRLPCPSPTPRACSNSCPSSQWCHPTISSSVVPFSHLQSFPASGSFPMSQFFTSGGQRIRASASASVLPMNIQDWFPLGLTGLISLHSKGLLGVFSNTTAQKHQFFGTQPSL